MHLAAGYNRTRIVQLLLQHGADVHAKDKGCVISSMCQQTWWFYNKHESKYGICNIYFITYCSYHILDKFPSNNKNVLNGSNYKIIDFYYYYFYIFSCSGLVPLHNACSYGHFEVTEMLLKVSITCFRCHHSLTIFLDKLSQSLNFI